jgi:hypothetical protein
MIRLLSVLLLSCLTAYFTSCSYQVVDGGSDFPNTRTVAGIILNPDGTAADGVCVNLVSSDYRVDVNPAGSHLAFESSSTDSNGYFVFEVKEGVEYNLTAVSHENGARLFKGSIHVESADVVLADLTLAPPGKVIVSLDGLSNVASVVLPGTEFSARIFDGYALFDSLPAGILPPVMINGEPSKDSLEVMENKTTAAAKALYVVKYVNGSLDSFDVKVLDEMRRTGIEFTVVDQNNLSASDTTGISLVCISTSVDQDTLKNFFTDMEKPVVNFEYYMQPYLGMTGDVHGVDYGSDLDVTTADIADTNHEICAGLGSRAVLFSSAAHYDWGTPEGDADLLIVKSGGTEKSMAYCYERGALMNSLTAPEKRASFLYWRQDVYNLSDVSWSIIYNMLIWSVK